MVKIAIILSFLFVSCAKSEDKDNTTAVASGESAASSSDTEVETESIPALDRHIASMQSLASASDEGGLSELKSATSNLVTKYQFEVKGQLVAGNYRQASYFWDKAEKDYVTLETAYNSLADSGSAGGVIDLWGEYQSSRDEMLALKKLWEIK